MKLHPITRSMKNALNKFRMIWPLTIRGVLITAIIYFCILSLGMQESDLVASIVGAILLICLLTFLLVLIPSSISIKRSLKLDNLGTQGKSHSKEECGLSLSLSNFKVPPLFSLDIERVFDLTHVVNPKDHPISSKVFQCRGSFKNPHQIISPLSFPHRGIFKQKHFLLNLSDYFGLTKISWRLQSPMSFSIYAQDKQIEPIPIMLASSVSGDLTSATDIRSGDLFDTKQYQAGDSLKRVLWKVYARSEELIVRYPEPAIIPEGELVAYCIALPEQDDVVSATLNYLKMVDEQNISFLAGFAGANGLIGTSMSSAEENSLQYPVDLSVRQAISEFDLFINTLRLNNHHPVEIILFTPRLGKKANLRESMLNNMIDAIFSQAEQMQLKVHIAEVECGDNTEHQNLLLPQNLLKKVVPIRDRRKPGSSNRDRSSGAEVYRVKFI